MSPAQVLKSAYDFSESAERRANLSAFSSPEPVSTFIFGIDKDSDYPQSTVSPKPSVEETHTKNSNPKQSPKSTESSEPSAASPVQVDFFIT